MAAQPSDALSGDSLLQELKRVTSVSGQGLQPSLDFETKFEEVMEQWKPTAAALAMARSIPGRHADDDWGRAVVRALEDAFRLRMTREQIQAQHALAASNDRLSKRMLFAAWVGIAVALAGVFVGMAQLRGG